MMIWGVLVFVCFVMSCLEIDYVVNQVVEVFLQCFRYCWVGVDVVSQFVGGQVLFLCQCEFWQQFGYVVVDQVFIQQFVVFGVGYQFDEFIGVIYVVCFGVGCEWEFGYYYVVIFVVGLLFGEFEVGNVWLIECCVW